MQNRHTIHWAERIHTERWYCDLDHEMTEEFDRQDSLESHFKSEHIKQLTASQLRGRLRRNRRIAARDTLVCPICDCKPGDILTAVNDDINQLLWAHIGRHLKYLAFLSLPYDQFAAGETKSTSESASTIRNDAPGNLPFDSTERDADFDAIPKTYASDVGTRQVRELATPSCLSRDDLCCRLRSQAHVTTFRAESELPVAVNWKMLNLKVKRASTLHADYEELAKRLGAFNGNRSTRYRNLEGELLALRKETNFRDSARYYFPNGPVKQLITAEAVLGEFKKVNDWEALLDAGDFSTATFLDKNIRYNREPFASYVAKHAPKTFAIALVSDFGTEELCKFMVKYIGSGFTDGDLPITHVPSINIGGNIGLSPAQQDIFFEIQWLFMPPSFEPGRNLVLSSEAILPFKTESVISQHGAHVKVSKVQINPDSHKFGSTQIVSKESRLKSAHC